MALGSPSQFRANPVCDRIAVNACAKHLVRLDFVLSTSTVTSQLPKAAEHSISFWRWQAVGEHLCGWIFWSHIVEI